MKCRLGTHQLRSLVLGSRLAHHRPKLLRKLVVKALPQDRQKAEVREVVEDEFSVVIVTNLVTEIRIVRTRRDILRSHRRRKWRLNQSAVALLEVLLKLVLENEMSRVC